MGKNLRTFFLSIYPPQKAAEIAETIGNAGYAVVPHHDPNISNICVLAESKTNIIALCSILGKLAPGIKWHGPID